MSHSIKLGKKGEFLVSQFLENNNFKILDKNFKSKYGEIDIIARKDEDELSPAILSFVEVKIRINPHFYLSELIVPSKQKKIIKTALYYIQKNNFFEQTIYRFDVALLEMTNNNDYTITYIDNAFTSL